MTGRQSNTNPINSGYEIEYLVNVRGNIFSNFDLDYLCEKSNQGTEKYICMQNKMGFRSDREFSKFVTPWKQICREVENSFTENQGVEEEVVISSMEDILYRGKASPAPGLESTSVSLEGSLTHNVHWTPVVVST